MKNHNEKLDNIRHSCAHLLAAAVKELWPGTHNAIGPAIENGFYQDFDFGKIKISETDLPKIEARMNKILQSWAPFEEKEVSQEQALKDFSDNPYKIELIHEFSKEGKKITENNPGGFLDLCKGGHSNDPKNDLKHFKLLKIAGAYWRGDSKKKMLTRIYGTCFPAKEELNKYLWQLEEVKKRDHKKLGKELELFMFHETAPGMAYWLPKGVVLYNKLVEFWRKEHLKRGYLETFSPLLNKKELFITSGHFDHYWQDMFVADMGKEEVYGLKAMNCPNAMIIYSYKPRSYKDLPIRISDTDPLHRFELSGVLNGLFRVRLFRQDDAHIFVMEEQIEEEFKNLFEIVERFYSIFNLDYSYRLGKRPEKFMGDSNTWDHVEQVLENILKRSGKKYFVAEKEGAFYGPKIDILMKDSLGREWQMGTLQLDFQQPSRFKLTYVDSNGKERTPIAIHRVIYGSLERFIGVLIEHYAGVLPLWISPIQVAILPISDRHLPHAEKVEKMLLESDVRSVVDSDNKTIGNKIRAASLQKIPYIVIIGDKEIQNDNLKVSVRTRGGKDLGMTLITEFIQNLKEQIGKFL